MKYELVRSALILIALLVSPVAFAGTVAATYTGTSQPAQGNNFGNAVGWGFIALADMDVTQLGIFDAEEPGLESSHTVALFENGGPKLAQATVPAGDAAPLVDGSRMVGISPVSLEEGEIYIVIADNWSSDEYVFGFGDVAFASQIDWLDGVTGSSNSVDSIISPASTDPGLLGPNFTYRIVPEPAAIGLLMSCFAVATVGRRNA